MTYAAGIGQRIRSLSPRERLLLLAAAVAIVLFLLVQIVIFPALAQYRKARAEIPLRRDSLARYESIRNGEGEVAGRLADAEARLKKREGGLLPGDDPAASGAFLQGILKPGADSPDTQLRSIRTLSPVSKGDYQEVAVQMDFQTSTEGLAMLLAKIAREPKILRVRKMTVNSRIYSAKMTNRPDTLTVSVVVAGLAGTPGETGPRGGGRP